MEKSSASGIMRKAAGLWPYLLIAFVGFASYFLTKLTIPAGKSISRNEQEIPVPLTHAQHMELAKHKSAERTKTGRLDLAAIQEGAIPNQRIIVFKDKAALEAFLKKTGNGVNLLGRIDRLNALLIGFGNESDLTGLLDGSEETAFNFPASIPEFGAVGAQDGAVPFGKDLLKWLGLEGDNSLWGTGVRIAVIDTGIADHLVFKNAIERINLIPLPANPADLNGHGTTVASLIASSNPFAPGVAPNATLISIRAANDNGTSSTWLITEALYAALDANPSLINISLGGEGRSALLDNAIAEVAKRGIPIIASAGNSGTEGVMQPAANPYVIAVGSVDRTNHQMAFSTSGTQLDISAAGFELNAAYPGNMATRISGTSGSAGVVTGVLAKLMSPNGTVERSGIQAVDLMLNNLNDIGAQGKDKQTGGGVPNVGTILYPKEFDASVNSINVTQSGQGNSVNVLVQNVGTETLLNAGVAVSINGVTTNANITTLARGESRVVSVAVGSGESLNIQSSVRLSSGQTDQRPSNDSMSQTSPVPSP